MKTYSPYTRRSVTRAIFNAHVKHRVCSQWQSYSKWITAFPTAYALYLNGKFSCVR